MLWRACRGNVFLRQAQIESPLEDPSNVCSWLFFSLQNNFFICDRFLGRQSLQVSVHHLLPRWSIEDSCQENLRRIPCNVVSMPRGTIRSSWNGNGCNDPHWRFEHRSWTNPRSSSSCSSCSRQEFEELVCQGSQNQSHLSHFEFVQFGCDPKMFDRWVLGTGSRYWDHPIGTKKGNG